jgi:hypothetical protein
MSIGIHCWNVVHGDANIITVEDLPKTSYVLDFGSKGSISDTVVSYAVEDAHRILKESEHIDIFITHLHEDHCNLLPVVTKGLKVHLVYYPAIPQPEPIAEYLGCALAFCIIKVPRFRIIYDTLKKGAVKSLSRGDLIELDNNLYVRVLWPPSNLSNHKRVARGLERKARELYKIVMRKSEKEGIKGEVDDLAGEIMNTLISKKEEDFERLIKDKDDKHPSPKVIWKDLEPAYSSKSDDVVDKDIRMILNGLKGVEDDINLVLKFYYGFPNSRDSSSKESKALALIPGDAPSSILDYLSLLEREEPEHHKYLAFLRASHHGTRYGKYINEHKNVVTWISWTKRFYSKYRSYPSSKYLLNSNFLKIAEDTRVLRMYIAFSWRFPYCILGDIGDMDVYICDDNMDSIIYLFE